jgi:hypothetical protein
MNRKPMSKQALYSKVSAYTPEIIERLLKLTDSNNENVALGACRTLLNKSIPDLKSHTINDGLEELMSNVVYVPEKKTLETPFTQQDKGVESYV